MLEVAENTLVTLPCDGVKELTDGYTRTWQRVNGEVLYLQYRYNNVLYERRPAARADMSLNTQTFTLTIGRVQVEDDSVFVCTGGDDFSSSIIRSVKLIINSM